MRNQQIMIGHQLQEKDFGRYFGDTGSCKDMSPDVVNPTSLPLLRTRIICNPMTILRYYKHL